MVSHKIDNLFGLKENWTSILETIDLDNDGRIDFNDFFTAAMDPGKVFTDQNIEKVFKMID
jgi:Ca2+-binding EF-hand superfamily protein